MDAMMKYVNYHPPYPMDSKNCGCDTELIEYLKSHRESGSLFHFGTGLHHRVGIELANPSFEVFGVTASWEEFEEYRRIVTPDPLLANWYKVLWCDAYCLSRPSLPRYTTLSCPHLCEYYGCGDTVKYARNNEERLLDLLLSQLESGGRAIFFTGSNGWERTRGMLERYIGPHIEREEDYRRLTIFRKR